MENTKLIFIMVILATALSAVSAAVGVINFIGVNSNKQMLGILTGDVQVAEADNSTIPLTEREEYVLTEAVMGQFYKTDENGKKKSLNVSITIGVAFNKNDAKYADTLALMSEKEGYVRDQITKILNEKEYDFMVNKGNTQILQEEILLKLKELFDTESIIEVYFVKNLQSER